MIELTSRKNPYAVHIKKLGTSRRYRTENAEFLCDGIKLLQDAVNSGIEICAVLTASNIPFDLKEATKVYHAERSIIDSLSPLTNAQDTLFVCKIPDINLDIGINRMGTHILLDGIQDPGNVGAIIRTANAFGMNSVILTGNCADIYNPKTVRATMGAIFRQRIYTMSLTRLEELRDSGIRFIAAASDTDSESSYVQNISHESLAHSIIAIGSEGSGISPGVLQLCAHTVSIPMEPGCESLNAAVAAAVLMWEAKGRKLIS